MRPKLLIIFLIGMTGSAGTAHPQPPVSLESHIVEGEFVAGDFDWMRGAFPGATAEQRAEYQAISDWLKICSSEARTSMLAQLEELGVVNARLGEGSVTFPLCDQVSAQPDVRLFNNFEDFSETLDLTRPIFDAMVSTTWLAESIAGAPTNSLTDELLHRPMAEQIYRNAFTWLSLDEPVDDIPLLTKKQRSVFSALLIRKLGDEDRTNTSWLQSVIEEHGWPTKSAVGEDASSQAWLLAQHADHDPAFQLRVLRLIEPLTVSDEVSPKNYAYLYDRVMLKLRGTQRYATQVTCEGGRIVPRPLENAAAMPEYRKSVGLVPFDEYLTWFSTPCPPE